MDSIPPRHNIKGINLNTGEPNLNLSLAIADPELSSKQYQQVLVHKHNKLVSHQ